MRFNKKKYHRDSADDYAERVRVGEEMIDHHNSGLVQLPQRIFDRIVYNIPMLRRLSKLHEDQANDA
jgi:hypothetical protein